MFKQIPFWKRLEMQKPFATIILRVLANLFEFILQKPANSLPAILNIVIFFLFKIPFSDLLEKSRVICQASGERCYHIFYQIFSGHLPNLTKELLLDKPIKDYYFIAQAELIIDGIDDKEEHKLTDEAFKVLNFSADEILNCYKLVAAILHMGNMKFKQRPREEQAETDETESKMIFLIKLYIV